MGSRGVGFIFEVWEEVETRSPSLFMSMGETETVGEIARWWLHLSLLGGNFNASFHFINQIYNTASGSWFLCCGCTCWVTGLIWWPFIVGRPLSSTFPQRNLIANTSTKLARSWQNGRRKKKNRTLKSLTSHSLVDHQQRVYHII